MRPSPRDAPGGALLWTRARARLAAIGCHRRTHRWLEHISGAVELGDEELHLPVLEADEDVTGQAPLGASSLKRTGPGFSTVGTKGVLRS